MSEMARLGRFSGNCLGRENERDAFREFLRTSDAGPGIDLCVVRGLGGIGKTTLSRAFVRDFVGDYRGAIAQTIECSALPPQPDIASLLRTMDSEAGALRDAAAKLDGVAAMVRSAMPPSDSDTSTVDAWMETRRAALELFAFFSSGAVETLAFGQLGSSASSAVLAGFQMVASAKGALMQVIGSLVEQNRIEDDDADIARDPERFVVEAIAEFLSGLTQGQQEDRRVLLQFDKAENLTEHLPRLVGLFEAAALRAQVHVSLILVGRLVRVYAADGSKLDIQQFLDTSAPNSHDVHLSPLGLDQVRALLGATHARIHGEDVTAQIPGWLVEKVTAISSGLPLWVASLAEALFTERATPWEDEGTIVHRMGIDILDLTSTVELIFREARIAERTDAFPLLVALALAPPGVPKAVICEAAQVSEAALLELENSYSFMNGSRLHDTARGVLRHLLSTSADARPIIQTTATHLQQWIEQKDPESSVADRDTQEIVELELWMNTERGVGLAIDQVLAGMPTASRSIGPLLKAVAWFVERRGLKPALQRLLAACTRAALPVILGSALTVDESDDARHAVTSASEREGDFSSALGRYLDEIERALRRLSITVSPQGQLGLDSMRLLWLAFNGFDDEAVELALDVSGRLDDVPEDAPVRAQIGRALLHLVNASVAWGDHGDTSTRNERYDRVDQLVRAITIVNQRMAPQAVRKVLETYGPRPVVLEASNELVRLRGEVEDNEFRFALGIVLIELGDFAVAEKVFREGLARDPDWIGGAWGRSRALLGMGETRLALGYVTERLRAARERPNLSRLGLERRGFLASEGIIALIAEDYAADPKDIVEAGEASKYGELLLTVFSDSPAAALRGIEALVGDGWSEETLALERAIALGRNGRHNEARELVELWRQSSIPAGNRHIEALLFDAARQRGWIEAPGNEDRRAEA